METLTIVGGGNVGKSLGLLWKREELAEVHCILNRSRESAQRAAGLLEQGRPITKYQEITPTSLVMLSVPDDAIESCCQALCEAAVLVPGTVVFHCSGSLASNVLLPARNQGALIASVHPLKSFADAAHAAQTFSGTPCGIEGDEHACQRLARLFGACGGKVFPLKPESKLLYHAGTVLACNSVTALIETALRCFEKAGIPRPLAMELVSPLASETIQNITRLGTVGALTGPIARGDAQLVRNQLYALERSDPTAAQIYKALSLVALELSRAKGQASPGALAQINQHLLD